MEIKLIGLGKMGLNLAKSLKKQKFNIKAFDLDQKQCDIANKLGIETYDSLNNLVASSNNHIYYLMVPAGKAINYVTDFLLKNAPQGAYIVDGGNTFYKDSIKRYHLFKANNQHFVDVGTSGGQEAALNGLCLMVGGTEQAIKFLKPIFNALSVDNGFAHVGPPGAGHYTKMIHNGIEYGMMQAIAEGCEILTKSKDFPNLDLAQVVKLWNHGSVIRSWLIELTAEIYQDPKLLDQLSDQVDASGEGLWTLYEALDLKVPAPVLNAALTKRYASLQETSEAGKILNALRFKFGGHKLNLK